MRLIRWNDGKLYAVFKNEDDALRWHWLFGQILRRYSVCFGGYFNAYQLSK